jgi:hypothetical protein
MKKILYAFLINMICISGSNVFISCTDKIDMTDRFTFIGKTITDYAKDDSTLFLFYKMLNKSKVSNKTKSSVATLLSARGNYTCFAPTNEAVKHFLDSIYNHRPYDIDTIGQHTADEIVLNCVIDNGTDDAYKSTDFNIGAIQLPTFNDRHILLEFDTIQGGQLAIILNNSSRIIQADIETTNGIIHKINRVISPSNSSLSALLNQTDNMRIFSHLLEETGWADSMVKYRDESYESLTEAEKNNKKGYSWQYNFPSPSHRYYGYTAFVEPDSIFVKKWGIPEPEVENGMVENWTEIMKAIKEKCENAYPDAASSNLKSEDNAINEFVAYHLLNYRVPYNYLVYHLTELGYYYRHPDQLTLDVWEYYVPMGKFKRVFKITQSAKDGRMSINRHCKYDNSFLGDFHEISCDRQGVQVFPTNPGHTNNALNGYYFPIGDVLVYDEDVPNKVLNERLRFDVQSLMPELMTNGVRSNVSRDWNIPPHFVDGFNFTDETQFSYITYGEGWRNWNGDELIAYGQVDFTFRLLPVPYSGTYEIRFGCTNQPDRIMAQIYFGTNLKNLPAVGLPLDFRTNTSSPAIDWVEDSKDEEANHENDKHMRNRQWMKGPKYAAVNTYTQPMTEPMRIHAGSECALRRIIWTGYMEAGKIYYVRVKSVLESTTNGIALDYMEIVPKWVYNGSEGEDVW